MEKHSKHESKAHTKKKSSLKIKKIAIWQIATVVFAILFVISIATRGGSSGASDVTSNEAGEKTIDFVTGYLSDGSTEITLKNVQEENEMYLVNFEAQGQTYPSYVSKDGKLLFLQVIDMDKAMEEAAGGQGNTEAPAAAQPSTTPKSEKPEVEVFVMSHCPYGTQIEKGVIPVAELLGDKIDFSIRYVYYAMHGQVEIDEQLNQHCIQEEQNDKFLPYLKCFLEESKGEECLATADVDTDMMETCVASTDEELKITENFEDKSTWLNGRFPLFDVDKELNTKYNVGGSPTLVINGASASAGRDSASLLKAVCDSFTTAPEECETALPSAQPSPGFGFKESASGATAATCG